jgi:hypothetical protein
MSRLINEPVTVHLGKDSLPTAFIWRRRLYKVTGVIYWWREPATWWHGEAIRLLIRVTAVNKTDGVYELSRLNSHWSLDRLLD